MTEPDYTNWTVAQFSSYASIQGLQTLARRFRDERNELRNEVDLLRTRMAAVENVLLEAQAAGAVPFPVLENLVGDPADELRPLGEPLGAPGLPPVDPNLFLGNEPEPMTEPAPSGETRHEQMDLRFSG